MVSSPQRLALVGLLALVPLAVFTVSRGVGLGTLFAMVCVVLTVASFFLMLAPTGGERDARPG